MLIVSQLVQGEIGDVKHFVDGQHYERAPLGWRPLNVSPPDPHVAALHRIADAIDGLAAAVGGERAKVRDDGR